MTLSIEVKQRYWFASMVVIGAFAIDLGACPEKISAWLVRYGLKIEVGDS